MEPAPNVKMVGNTTQLHNVVSGKTHVLPTKFWVMESVNVYLDMWEIQMDFVNQHQDAQVTVLWINTDVVSATQDLH